MGNEGTWARAWNRRERSTYHFQLRRFYPIILILLHVSDVYCQNFPQVLSCLLFCFVLFSYEMTWWTQALNFRVVKLIHLLKVSTLHFTWKTLPEKRKMSTYTFFLKFSNLHFDFLVLNSPIINAGDPHSFPDSVFSTVSLFASDLLYDLQRQTRGYLNPLEIPCSFPLDNLKR